MVDGDMSIGGIIRPATEAEKQEMIVITERRDDVRDYFIKKLKEYQQKFTRERKPYDYQCAKLDFEDEVKKFEEEDKRRSGKKISKKEDDVRINFNFNKYGDAKRFEEWKEPEEIQERRMVDGFPLHVTTGYYHNYQCNRGHKFAVEIPIQQIRDKERGK